jgi:hypothetical protein
MVHHEGLTTDGSQQYWDGHQWNLSVSGLTGIHPGTATSVIAVNGTVIERLNAMMYLDPASG